VQKKNGQNISGKGDYKTIIRDIASIAKSLVPKGTFAKGGRALGAMAGSAFGPELAGIGGALGGHLGSAVSKITGFGDYNGPGSGTGRGPQFHGGARPQFTGGGMSVRVRFTEFITTVAGSTTFNPARTNINPGNEAIFPWLSKIARNYEQYRLHGLVFHYEPNSGSIAGASPALGNIMMATQYDVQDPAFTSVSELMNYVFATTSMPCTFCNHAVECAPRQTQIPTLKVRTGPLPPGATAQLYDAGLFTVATSGQQSVYVLGQLYVAYDVEFLKPKLVPCAGFEAMGARNLTANLVSGAKVEFSGPTVEYDVKSNFPLVYNTETGSLAYTAGSTNLAPVVCPGVYPGSQVSNADRLVFMRRAYFSITINFYSANGAFTVDPSVTTNGVDIIDDDLYAPATGGLRVATEASFSTLSCIVFSTRAGSHMTITTPGNTSNNTTWSMVVSCLPFPMVETVRNGSGQERTFSSTYPSS